VVCWCVATAAWLCTQHGAGGSLPGSQCRRDTASGWILGWRFWRRIHSVLMVCSLQPIVSLLLYCHYTVWCKKIPPKVIWLFFIFFTNSSEFLIAFTHLLYVPVYGRLQIFIQLSPTLTKLCHIKRDCSKCPQSAKTHARRLRKLLLAFFSVASQYKINTFIMSTNMLDMTWRQQWRHLLSKQT